MPIVFAFKSDVGQIRKHNEDFIWVDEDVGIFIIADGLGGHEAGEVASRLTATTVAQSMQNDIGTGLEDLSVGEIKALMLKAFEISNEVVIAAANEDGQRRRMGATIVAVLVRLPAVYICHAGDTRAYLAREKTLSQLTQDDSFVAELIAAGVISKDEAKTHMYQSVVTKAIGQGQPLEPTFTELTVRPDDWLLMCSDGLTNMVSEETILAELQQAQGDPDYVVETLTDAANAAGGKDNISIVALRVLADEA